MARRLLVAIIALLLAAQIVRNAAVAGLADRFPDFASRLWRGHPSSEIALAMSSIGSAARERKAVPAATFELMDNAAVKAPLAPEPFLVRGVQAQLAGNASLAVDAFAAAGRRDPHSLPAHYFLAEAFFQTGDTRRGLSEIGVLARLAPSGVKSLAPYLAAYAKDRTTWPQLRELFGAEPQLEESTFAALSSDASNADTVLALAGRHRLVPEAAWLPTLLNSLVTSGQYARAHQIWGSVSPAQGGPNQWVYDGRFVQPKAPPPFNWMLMSSVVGLAERAPKGGLHVIFYGNQDGLLARQLLVLPPGAYRMAMTVAGNPADLHALTWSLRCEGSQEPIAAIRLDVVGSRPWVFDVPQQCPAQWLELSGVSSDLSRQSEATVSNLTLVREQGNG